MDTMNITIIGAGVIGLAIAVELADVYDNIIVLDRNDHFGRETSSRNSEVIHSGIYYPSGSLKATLCLAGTNLLFRYCEKHSVPHARLGKLIVAADAAEISQLEQLQMNGLKNGVRDLRIVDAAEVERLQPSLRAVAALHSPATAIIDSHALMKTLYGQANASGVLFSFCSDVARIEKSGEGYIVGMKADDFTYFSRVVINAAGLNSDHVAALAGIDIDAAGYKLDYYKGSYFSYAKKHPIRMLVYPVPHKDLAGLGIHATLDMGNRLRFGPDAERVNEIEYSVDHVKRDAFYEGASRIIKGLDRESFLPEMAGIRPKLKGAGVRDFVIQHEKERGLQGLVNLVGIESPGLTASLAIAKRVRSLVDDILQ